MRGTRNSLFVNYCKRKVGIKLSIPSAGIIIFACRRVGVFSVPMDLMFGFVLLKLYVNTSKRFERAKTVFRGNWD